MAENLHKNNMNVILIQIDEAHSSAWPMALDKQVDPQSCYEDRLQRAIKFKNEYNCPFPIYVDGWDNIFAETFRAWPDKYHCVNSSFTLLAKSEYGTYSEALIDEDYTVLLSNFLGL